MKWGLKNEVPLHPQTRAILEPDPNLYVLFGLVLEMSTLPDHCLAWRLLRPEEAPRDLPCLVWGEVGGGCSCHLAGDAASP